MNPTKRRWEFCGPSCIMEHPLSGLVATGPTNGYESAEWVQPRFGLLRILTLLEQHLQFRI
jgi:hypothetical protein